MHSPLLIAGIILIIPVLLLLRILRKPLKWIIKILINAGLGWIALFIFNFIGSWIGISLDLSWANVIVTGVLGIPGVIILLLVKYLL